MRSRSQARLTLAILLAAGAFCLRISAQPAAKGATTCGDCKNCQSPRSLRTSMPGVRSIRPGPDDATIYYMASQEPLRRCSQHYHCWIENLQQCTGQSASAAGGPAKCDTPKVGDWVEIHTVYAPTLGTACNDNYESTDCCLGEPKVVLAYHAKVTKDADPVPKAHYWGPVLAPLPVFSGAALAEWSGSTTGPNKQNPPPGECKPAAQWSFALGCDFTVSLGQLAVFTHAEPARGLQPESRLSTDLRRVPPK